MATKGQKQFGDIILDEVLMMKEQGKRNLNQTKGKT